MVASSEVGSPVPSGSGSRAFALLPEGRHPREALVEHRGQREDIRGGPRLGPAEDLRRAVGDALGGKRAAGRCRRQIEVHEHGTFHGMHLHDHVLRAHVAVHEAGAVGGVEGVRDLAEQPDRPHRRDSLREQVSQVHALHLGARDP